MPKFDPNKPFDQVESSGSKFDPNQEFEKLKEPSSGEHAKGFIQGFANLPFAANKAMGGASLPETQAMMATKMSDPNAEVNSELSAKGFKIKEPQWNSYGKALEDFKAQRDATAESVPLAYYGGEAAAGLIPVGGAAVKGVGLLNKLAKTGLVRAMSGGAIGSYLYDKYVSK